MSKKTEADPAPAAAPADSDTIDMNDPTAGHYKDPAPAADAGSAGAE